MAVWSRPRGLEGEESQETSYLLGTAQHDEPTKIRAHYIRIVAAVTVSVFLLEIGDFMLRAPTIRLMEDILCRQYYSLQRVDASVDLNLPIPEERCKIAPIQGELAMLRGWDTTLSCIPGMLLAIPYGSLADKIGRKTVLIISLLGLLLSLIWTISIFSLSDVVNIKWFWFGNAFFVIGGGPVIVKSMYYAIIADVAPEAHRATVFFQVLAASLIATVIGVPSAWYMMERSLFLPLWVGVAVFSMTIPMTFMIPETLKRSKLHDSMLDDEGIVYADADLSPPKEPSIKGRLLNFWSETKEASLILKSPMLLALSFTFLFQTLGGRTNEYQYLLASERFHWKLADASFLIPIGSVANFIVLIVVLPYLYHMLTKRNVSSIAKDLVVVRGSLIIVILGCLVIAWGPLPGIFCVGVIISACGIGLYSALRSLVTSLVHPDQVSRLYALMAIGDTLGAMLYSPLTSKAYGWGIKLGGPWTGMVFLICALMFAVVSIPVWFIRKPTEELDLHG